MKFDYSELRTAVKSERYANYYDMGKTREIISKYEERVCNEIAALKQQVAERDAKIYAYDPVAITELKEVYVYSENEVFE